MAFTTPFDIANRGLQHIGVRRITNFSDNSLEAAESGFLYDNAREAELRCNLWRFATRRVILRPVDTLTAVLATNAQTTSGAVLHFASTTGVTLGPVEGTNIPVNTTVASFTSTTVTLSQNVSGTVASGAAITFGPQTLVWTPPTYDASTTYALGLVVVDASGVWWQSKVAGNVGHTPAAGAYWARYCGVDTLEIWQTTRVYEIGELVLGSDSSVYLNLVAHNGSGSTGHDPTATTGFWLLVNGTTVALQFIYPIGTGPSSDIRSNNVFRLPHGFLRQAPTDPKGGANVWLGAPHGNVREDWVFENDYIISARQGPLMLRFVANVVDVPDMDPMFCELLAARLGYELAPRMAPEKFQQCVMSYKEARNKAVTVNGIEIGPIDLDVDDFITCRA
jgi:hypothetical protein